MEPEFLPLKVEGSDDYLLKTRHPKFAFLSNKQLRVDANKKKATKAMLTQLKGTDHLP